MTDRNRREIQDEAARRNIDPGTGGSGGALDMGMTTGEAGSNFGEADPGVGSDLSGATGGPGDVTGPRSTGPGGTSQTGVRNAIGGTDRDAGAGGDEDMQANRPGKRPEAGFGGDMGAGSSTDVGGTTASGRGGGNVMGGSGTRSAAGAGETSVGDVGFDFAGGGRAPSAGTGAGTGSGADLDSSRMDTPGTTVRSTPGSETAAGGGPRVGRGVDDDRPNAGDASDRSAFDASEAYAGIESDDALAGRDKAQGGR